MSQTRTTAGGGMKTSFGFTEVGEGEKQTRVNDVFHKVAQRYDVMNDLMSAGMHRVWKDAMVTALNPPKSGRWRSLDVAGGTGDIAFRIVEASRGNAEVTVLDINGSMLEVGRDRAQKRGIAENLTFVEANAEDLPFEDDFRRLYGRLRHPQRAGYSESARRSLSRAEARRAVPVPRVFRGRRAAAGNRLREVVVQRDSAHRPDGDRRRRTLSLSGRIDPQVPEPGKFRAMIRKAGFERVTYTNYTGGVAALHSGWKL
jgi:demethylmenaquinone methyltransferase/2-methoxy-6-polyprenyl-1,4-benzoquinol methylase